MNSTRKEIFEAIIKKEEYDAAIVKATTAPTRLICEVIRISNLRVFNALVDKRSRITDARKFFSLPWDTERAQPQAPQTKEDMKWVMKAIATYYKDKNKLKSKRQKERDERRRKQRKRKQ